MRTNQGPWVVEWNVDGFHWNERSCRYVVDGEEVEGPRRADAECLVGRTVVEIQAWGEGWLLRLDDRRLIELCHIRPDGMFVYAWN